MKKRNSISKINPQQLAARIFSLFYFAYLIISKLVNAKILLDYFAFVLFSLPSLQDFCSANCSAGKNLAINIRAWLTSTGCAKARRQVMNYLSNFKVFIQQVINHLGNHNVFIRRAINFLAVNIIVIALFILSNTNSVSALGISPVQLDKDLSALQPFEGSFSVVNNEGKEMTVVLEIRGELESYISLQAKTLHFTKEEKEKKVSYQVNIPENLLKPGVHEAEIISKEIPGSISHKEDEVIIAAASAMVYKIKARIPFPGKYLESKLVISNTQVNEEVRFVMPVFNFGKEKINAIKAKIKILGPTNELIKEFETDEISLEPHAQSSIVGIWKAEANPGFYHAIAEIDYDGKTIILEQDFTLGELFVDVYRIDVPDFTLGSIAKFDIYLENKWNQPIQNVYGEMTITDQKGTVFTKFKTASIDMQPLAKDKIVAYWDTKEASIGDYNIRLLVNYADKFTEKLIKATVNLDSIYTDLAPTGQVIGARNFLGKNTTLTLLIIILLFINIGWFWYFIRSKKKNKPKMPEQRIAPEIKKQPEQKKQAEQQRQSEPKKPMQQSENPRQQKMPAKIEIVDFDEEPEKKKTTSQNKSAPKIEIVDLPEEKE